MEVRHLDNWSDDAILVDVQISKYRNLLGRYIKCPWCGHSHQMVVHPGQEVSGKAVCRKCAQFFRFVLVTSTGHYRTRRLLARPKPSSLVGGR